MKFITVLIHMAPQTQTVNDSNMQEVLERNPQIQVMTTNTSGRVQNQSSRQALVTSIRTGRSFMKSTDSSLDMNPDSVVFIKDTLVKMAQAFNRTTDEEPNVTHSNNTDYIDETSV